MKELKIEYASPEAEVLLFMPSDRLAADTDEPVVLNDMPESGNGNDLDWDWGNLNN